jgi:hypothetical protein
MSVLTLARELGKTAAEVEEMSLSEFNEWIAFFDILEEKRKANG